VLIDLSLAVTTSATSAIQTDVIRTDMRTYIGTSRYMSPEAIKDLNVVNDQSDLFSVG